MGDKRNYKQMTIAALLIIGLLLLFYTLTPIPELSLHAQTVMWGTAAQQLII